MEGCLRYRFGGLIHGRRGLFSEFYGILPPKCAEVHHIIYLVMFIRLALLFTAFTFNQFTLYCYCFFTTFIKFMKMTPQLMLSHLKMTPQNQ